MGEEDNGGSLWDILGDAINAGLSSLSDEGEAPRRAIDQPPEAPDKHHKPTEPKQPVKRTHGEEGDFWHRAQAVTQGTDDPEYARKVKEQQAKWGERLGALRSFCVREPDDWLRETNSIYCGVSPDVQASLATRPRRPVPPTGYPRVDDAIRRTENPDPMPSDFWTEVEETGDLDETTYEYITWTREASYEERLSRWLSDPLRYLEVKIEGPLEAKAALEAIFATLASEPDWWMRTVKEFYLWLIARSGYVLQSELPIPQLRVDFWQQIKQGQAHPVILWFARTLVQVLSQPGLAFRVGAQRLGNPYYGKGWKQFEADWYAGRSWTVWNFPDEQTLSSFKGQVTGMLEAYVGADDTRFIRDHALRALGEIDERALFNFVPSNADQWARRPTHSMVGGEPPGWYPDIIGGRVQEQGARQLMWMYGEQGKPLTREELLALLGYEYAVVKAKTAVYGAVEAVGWTLRIFGI